MVRQVTTRLYVEHREDFQKLWECIATRINVNIERIFIRVCGQGTATSDNGMLQHGCMVNTREDFLRLWLRYSDKLIRIKRKQIRL